MLITYTDRAVPVAAAREQLSIVKPRNGVGPIWHFIANSIPSVPGKCLR